VRKNYGKELMEYLNKHGMPVPMLRDPADFKPSVSFTMLVVAFLLYVGGMVGKWSSFLGHVNMSEARDLLIITCSLYFARKSPMLGGGNSAEPDAKPEADTQQKN
jgi:hypothetical protein